jgi:hypothetical protein
VSYGVAGSGIGVLQFLQNQVHFLKTFFKLNKKPQENPQPKEGEGESRVEASFAAHGEERLCMMEQVFIIM